MSHEGLLKALGRVNVEDNIIRTIRSIYRRPKFKVESDGFISGWHEQKAGIRQGCLLSPYAFIALMTAMMSAVKRLHGRRAEQYRVHGAEFDEVLYADDTIWAVSTTTGGMPGCADGTMKGCTIIGCCCTIIGCCCTIIGCCCCSGCA